MNIGLDDIGKMYEDDLNRCAGARWPGSGHPRRPP
jgi:hypothetical protein